MWSIIAMANKLFEQLFCYHISNDVIWSRNSQSVSQAGKMSKVQRDVPKQQ